MTTLDKGKLEAITTLDWALMGVDRAFVVSSMSQIEVKYRPIPRHRRTKSMEFIDGINRGTLPSGGRSILAPQYLMAGLVPVASLIAIVCIILVTT